ncbi:AAA family ATPase [Desulfogranum japonicum]|uniref:AAA family ATPase n=1 Tax=Desulfogranum japonicum TaxID=231447 RepID=UPI00041A4B02|nr:hypothetical protein [Desulfogranum japonicum]
MQEQWYSAFGLAIRSQLPVMEFSPIARQQRCDVHIRLEQPKDLAAFYTERNFLFNIDTERGTAVLYFSGVGEYRLTVDDLIVLRPAPCADNRTLALYLSGVVFAVLLYLRGYLVFHGSCVADADGRVIALVGDSGAGKSTLAGRLMQHGYSVLSDDVVALDMQQQTVRVLPAFPLLKIHPNMVEHISPSAGTLLPVQDGEVKRYLPVPACNTNERYALQAICFLEQGDRVSCTRISARQAMLKNIRFTMPTRLMQQVGGAGHFQQCAAVSQSVPSFEVTRTSQADDLEQLQDCILSAVVAT